MSLSQAQYILFIYLNIYRLPFYLVELKMAYKVNKTVMIKTPKRPQFKIQLELPANKN